MTFAEVVIPLPLPRTYTYSVPEEFVEAVVPGVRVEVSFGRQKRYAGMVKSVTGTKPEGFEPKPVLNVLDGEPVLHPPQLELWSWVSEYYLCTEGEVMAAALPAHFKLNSETLLLFNEEFGDDFSELDDDEYLVAEGLQLRRQLKLEEVQDILDSMQVYPVVKRLIDKRVCLAMETLKEGYTPKRKSFVRLHPDYASEQRLEALLNGWGERAPKQLELLLAYLQLRKAGPEVEQSELLKKSGATAAQLKSLADKNILLTERLAVDRIPRLPCQVDIDFTLTEGQQQALEGVRTALAQKSVCLLHGVTSSGKTQVYVHLIAEAIAQGRQVLYLLPEIALTAQVIRRLQRHFGGHIGVYHSKFNPNERVEIWNRVRTGETKVVLGARSSLFMPFRDLGLVIVDEEQDASYKQQDPAPRYNARDAAVYYASRVRAKVVLGSATPSMETYYNAVAGRYGWVELNERFGGLPMPAIELADTRVEGRRGPRVILSESLRQAMEKTLSEHRQVILFQNRRGYAPYLTCGTCHQIPHCEHCDVTLTYHKLNHRLQCHYCGATYPRPLACVACGSANWQERNFGTERIEEEMLAAFPSARVARMDVDSIRGKTAHDALIHSFEKRELDILVGTQMVVKGLDFDHVGLVGVLDADGLLGFADFRVNERAFQLMEQVSGRAGRKGSQGRVVVQTSQPGHPVLQFVTAHDYKGFYSFESEARRRFGYPPYTRIIKVTFKHKDKSRSEDAAGLVVGNLSREMGRYIVGPAEPVVGRIRQLYHIEFILKLPREAGIHAKARHMLRQQQLVLQNDRLMRSVLVQFDADPM